MSFKHVLQTTGLKSTKARLALLEILSEKNTPLDAGELILFLEKKELTVDQATVYRILDTFTKKGLVTRFEFQEGKFRYELAGGEHHHLICQQCGGITDVSDCNIDAVVQTIRKEKGFLVKSHSLEFYGVCSVCQT